MPIHGYPGNVITANPTAPTVSSASGVWTTEQQLIAKAAGNWPFTIPTQQIGSSLRFNPADSAYLNRTLGSSNRRTFTFSAWVKRSLLASDQHLLGCIDLTGGNNRQFGFLFQGGEYLNVFHYNNGTYQYYPTAALYRDTSAWYHVVCAIDTTQATGSNRAKIYVNGVLQATNGAVDFTQNTDLFINSGLNTGIGTQVGTGTGNSYFFGGYMAEVYFIDGQQLTPSSFGRTNTATGVWEPLAYTGTYGTNGFYLNFSDNSGTTSTTLGKDSSGNGNNWTPNNFSVTAGVGNDSLVDSPTSYGTDTGVGGEVRSNYCTLNPLDVSANTLSNGNLDITYATNSDTNRGGTIAVSTGKWYFEATVQAVGGIYAIIGVTSGVATATPLGTAAYQYSYISSTGNKFNNNSSTAYGNTYTTGDVIGVALDMDNGKVWFSKNGTFQASGDPAAGTNQAFSGLSGSFSPAINARNNSIVNLNCGQRAFAYTAPSGFKALCTQNLPTPTIGATSTTQARKYMNVVTYTGNGGTYGTGGQNITGVGFQPDLVWIKSRNNIAFHGLWDAVRGTGKYLGSNTTDAESGNGGDLMSAFNSDGFNVNTTYLASNTNETTNRNTWTYAAWNWKANGAGSSNTAGTITSTVSANTTSGFSIVSFAFPAVASKTVGHGLGVAPSMVIVKSRSNGTQQWITYHASSGNTGFLCLNKTDAFSTNSTVWDNTSPTSTVFTLGSGFTSGNFGANGIAYCFAPVAGYSAFGSYTGNASADGPFIYLGFRPEFIMIKASSSTGDWVMEDVARSPYNVSTNYLVANASTAEQTGQLLDFVSNGFKIRVAVSGAMNSSGVTYIYAAFAESPFKYSLAR